MEFEAPIDAWYVWVGVSLVSIAIAGIALAIPAQPPPDADEVAGTLDRVAASGYDASATVPHDATHVRLGSERIGLRNDGGTDEARISFGTVVALPSVNATESEQTALEGVVAGERMLDSELESVLAVAVAEAKHSTGEWVNAEDSLRARAVSVSGERVILVSI